MTRWQVQAFDARQTVAAKSRYHWDNRRRQPATSIVAQLTLEGCLHYQDLDGSERLIGPGQLLLFGYQEPTAYYLPTPRDCVYRCAWCVLDGVGLAAQIQDVRRRFGSVFDAQETGLLHAYRRLLNVAQRPGPRGAVDHTEAVHRFVLDLFRSCEQMESRRGAPVRRAIEQVVRDPYHPWSLKTLAEEHGCSREHFARVFHDTIGQPPGAFLAQARLKRAIELITQSSLTLGAVARQAGFGTPHAMARRIRQATGASPASLRQRSGGPGLDPDDSIRSAR